MRANRERVAPTSAGLTRGLRTGRDRGAPPRPDVPMEDSLVGERGQRDFRLIRREESGRLVRFKAAQPAALSWP